MAAILRRRRCAFADWIRIRWALPHPRRSAMRALAALCTLTAVVAFVEPTPARQTPASRPNIVIIQADDLGYGDVSAYGQTKFETPSIDRLAREGIRFTQYYA